MKNRIKAVLLMALMLNPIYAKIMQVDEVVNLALDNSLQIKISKGDIEGTKYKKGQTKALYFPKLKLSGGVVHFNQTPDLVVLANKLGELNNGLYKAYNTFKAINPTLAGFAKTPGDELKQVGLKDDGLNYQSVKLSLEQPLYTGGKITAVNKQVDLSIEISELENEKVINNVAFEAKKSYYNVVLAKRSLATVNEIYKGIEKHVEEAKAYQKAGFISQLDVIRAEAKLSEMRQKVVQAENSVDVAKAYLEFVIGKELPKDFEANTEIIVENLDRDLAYYEELAYKNRVELKIYENKLKLAKENEKVMKSQNKPLIAIQGEYKYEGTDLTKEDAKWQIGLVGSWTAFDGGSTKSQINEAKSLVDKANNGVALVKDSIHIEVKKAYLDTINAYETIKVAEKALEQAKEVVNQAREAYEYTKLTYDRLEKLFKEGVIPQQKMDGAKAELEVSKARLNQAEQQYALVKEGAQLEDIKSAEGLVSQAEALVNLANVTKLQVSAREQDMIAARAQQIQAQAAVDEVMSYINDSSIKAPVSGTITIKNADKGELVSTGMPIISIANLKDVWANIKVKETAIADFKVGDTVDVMIPGDANKIYKGKVTSIASKPSFATERATQDKGSKDIVAFAVKIKLENEDLRLKPGMTATINLQKIK